MWMLRLLGYLSAGLSLFGLFNKYMEQPLSDIFGELLVFYQQLLHPVAELVGNGAAWLVDALIGVELPSIPEDAIILYLLGAAAGSRCSRLILSRNRYLRRWEAKQSDLRKQRREEMKSDDKEEDHGPVMRLIKMLPMPIRYALGTVLILLLLLFIACLVLFWPITILFLDLIGGARFAREICVSIFAAILFFAFNAGLLFIS